MAMGGLGVSLAGFPGLITAFDRTAISGSRVADEDERPGSGTKSI